MSAHNIDKDKLKELAKDPQNVVYGVKYDTVEYTPMETVKKVMMIVRDWPRPFAASIQRGPMMILGMKLRRGLMLLER